jgi:hypothetical protein
MNILNNNYIIDILNYIDDSKLDYLKIKFIRENLYDGNNCKLYDYYDINQILEYKEKKFNVEKLLLDETEDLELSNIPNYIKYIKLTVDYDNDISNLPDSVISIICGDYFRSPINKYPVNLKYLDLGFSYNEELKGLPETLEHLEVGFCFEYSINNIPDNIKTLKIKSREYIYPIEKLPNNLKKLSIYDMCDSVLILPDKLEELVLMGYFNYEFEYLPQSLKKLYLNNNYRKHLRLKIPKHIEVIYDSFIKI